MMRMPSIVAAMARFCDSPSSPSRFRFTSSIARPKRAPMATPL
jgi:hypothetical protein